MVRKSSCWAQRCCLFPEPCGLGELVDGVALMHLARWHVPLAKRVHGENQLFNITVQQEHGVMLGALARNHNTILLVDWHAGVGHCLHDRHGLRLGGEECRM